MFFKSLVPPGKCIGLFSQYSPRPRMVLIAGGGCPHQGRGTPEGLGTQVRGLGSVLLTGRRPRDQTQVKPSVLGRTCGLSRVFPAPSSERPGATERKGGRRDKVSQGARRAGAQTCGRLGEAARAGSLPPSGHSAGPWRELAHAQPVRVWGTPPPTAQDHSILSSPAPTPSHSEHPFVMTQPRTRTPAP